MSSCAPPDVCVQLTGSMRGVVGPNHTSIQPALATASSTLWNGRHVSHYRLPQNIV